jgi:RNA polymerase sigma-70 factor
MHEMTAMVRNIHVSTSMGQRASASSDPPSQPELVAEAWAQGRHAWPRITLGLEHFRSHCQNVLGSAPPWSWSCHGRELYLCCACAAGDPAAHAVLREQFLSVVERQLARSHDNRELVQEALQVLHIKLLVGPKARLHTYAGRGPLLGWLLVAGKRTALDLLRSGRSQRAAARRVRGPARHFDPDPVGDVSRARYAEAFRDGLQKSIGVLDTEDRSMMRRAYVEGKTIDQLGDACAIHRSTAARRLQRIKRRIAVLVRQQLTQRHALTDSDFDDVAQDLCAELPLSLQALLTSRSATALEAGGAPRPVACDGPPTAAVSAHPLGASLSR